MEGVCQYGKDREKDQEEAYEDPGQRPFIPGPSLPQTLPEQPALEQCEECDQCKAPHCETCDSCKEEGPMATKAQSRGAGAQPKSRARWTEVMCELTGPPATTIILHFFMRDVQRSQ